ncbi:MAG: MFS transporter [Desulfovibrionaceae bacterium]|jgi:MFS family permease|nr:MFS transporter [Desulfovibrionaceae bacterium]
MHDTPAQRAALIAVTATNFFAPFMVSAVSVALPAIQRSLGANAVQLGLVETVYILSLTVGLLPVGRLGDILGRSRVFAAGVAVFTAAALLLSMSWSIESFIAIRTLQGLGASSISTAGVAILGAIFPPERRGRAMGWAVSAVYAGLSLGPFVGGVITTHLGWRWIFALSAPLGAISLALILTRLRGLPPEEACGEPFDWKGSLAYAAAMVLLILGALRLETSNLGWGLLLGGVAAFALFDRLQTRTAHPILDTSLFRTNRIFALSSLATTIHYAGTFGVTFFMSLYLQFVKGFSAQTAGAVLVLQPGIMALLSPLAGRLADRLSPARVSTAGMAVTCAGLGVATLLRADSPLPLVVGMLTLMGVGFALFSSPNTITVLDSVPRRHFGAASGVVAAARSMGMMLSMCIITAAFGIFLGHREIGPGTLPGFLSAMHVGLVIFTALCALATGLSVGRMGPPPKDAARAGDNGEGGPGADRPLPPPEA